MRIVAFFVSFGVVSVRADLPAVIPRLEWPAGPVSYTNVLRVVEEFSLPVPNADVSHGIGEQSLLFDINPDYYVAIVKDDFAPVNKLVAFARSASADGTAWITNEKQLIFAKRVSSSPGRILIRRGEVLPLLDENARAYLVMIERFGRQVTMEIPKSVGKFLPQERPPPPVFMTAEPTNPPAQQIAAEPQPESEPKAPVARPIVQKPASGMSRPSGVRITLNEEAIRKLQPTVTFVEPDQPAEKPKPIAKAAPSAPTPAPPPAQPPAEQTPPIAPPAQQTAQQQPIAPTPPPEPAPTVAAAPTPKDAQPNAESKPAPIEAPANLANVPEPSSNSFISLSSLTLWILMGTIVIEAGMLIMTFRKRRAMIPPPAHPPAPTPASAPTNEVFSYSSVGESIVDSSAFRTLVDESGDLRGDLDKFSLGHVVQFLHSSSESGTLAITTPEDQTDKLIFDRGQIIDAVCGNRCGEAAAEMILRKRKGTFRFSHEDNSRRLRLIHYDTMAMLMDAARAMDEQGL